MLGRASRTLPYLCLTVVFCRWESGDSKALGWKKSQKKQQRSTRAKRELVSLLVHAQRALHTQFSAHDSNGSLIDKRNGQDGVLVTRVTHVLCHWWKSVFAAMVRESVSEGGDQRFSPNWHGFLRGRRREDLSWKIPLELAHRHEQRFLLHRERNDGGGKRTNVQGRSLDGSETAKRGGLFAGTRWRIHVRGGRRFAHGDVGGATHLLLGPSTKPLNDGTRAIKHHRP